MTKCLCESFFLQKGPRMLCYSTNIRTQPTTTFSSQHCMSTSSQVTKEEEKKIIKMGKHYICINIRLKTWIIYQANSAIFHFSTNIQLTLIQCVHTDRWIIWWRGRADLQCRKDRSMSSAQATAGTNQTGVTDSILFCAGLLYCQSMDNLSLLVLCWVTVLPFHGQSPSSSSVLGYCIAIPWTISVF